MARPPGGERKTESAPSFQRNLAAIIAKPLTPQNSTTYFDDLLSELALLADRAAKRYEQERPEEYAQCMKEGGKALTEDRAFLAYGVDSVPELLSRVAHMRDDMNAAMAEIDRRISAIDIPEHARIVVPPISLDLPAEQSGESDRTGEGQLQDRLRILMYILRSRGIDVSNPAAVELRQGSVREIRRAVSYTKVSIPSLNRDVLVCDQSGNATFVFAHDRLRDVLREGEDIADFNKTELEKLIHTHPGIGVSFRFREHWTERLRGYLENPLDEENEDTSAEGIPQVSVGEAEEWRGFFTDPEEGKHWGGIPDLTSKLSKHIGVAIDYQIVAKRIKDARATLPVKLLRGARGHRSNMHSFEDVLPLFSDFASTPPLPLAEEGAWKQFHESDGIHYGTVARIREKFQEEGINPPSKTSVNDLVNRKANSIRRKPIPGGKERQLYLYAYEDVKEGFGDRRETLPHVSAEDNGNDWKGFYTAPDGRHFAYPRSICLKLGISEARFSQLTKDIKPELRVFDLSNQPKDAYCFEEIETRYNTEESEGWKKFRYDANGNRYGTIYVIATKLSEEEGNIVPKNTINQRLIRLITSERIEAVDSSILKLQTRADAKFKRYLWESVRTKYYELYPLE